VTQRLAIFVATFALINVGLVAACSSGDSNKPTASTPTLTDREAIGLVVAQYPCKAQIISQNAAASYNGGGKWMVTYTTGTGLTYRWTVLEGDHSVIPISDRVLTCPQTNAQPNCPTPTPPHYLAVGSAEWRAYQECLARSR
jgi:hypothetical protein